MTSQLNVDTIVDKAGSGGTNVKVANTSTYVSDGGNATQNTVQALPKCWVRWNMSGTPANVDTFNISSISDDGTGYCTQTYTNNFSNSDYAVTACSGELAGGGNRSVGVSGSTQTPSTSAVGFLSFYFPAGSGASPVDETFNCASWMGDLA